MTTGCDRYAVLTDTTTTVTVHQAEALGPVVARSPSGEANSELCGSGGIKQNLQASSQQQSPQLKLASSQSHGYSSFGSAVKIILDHIVTSTASSNTSESIGYNYLLKFEGQSLVPQYDFFAFSYIYIYIYIYIKHLFI